ncbi:MAG: hypothetical protein ACYDCF_08460 [Burkholderiales bacterium]
MTAHIHHALLALLLGAVASVVPAHAVVTCPTPPNEVQVVITSQVSYDAAAHLYTYRYTLHSTRRSRQNVEEFDIGFDPPVTNVRFPTGWFGMGTIRSGWQFGTYMAERPTVGFSAMAIDLKAPVQGIAVPPSTASIPPGQTVTGYSFQSPHPPGPAPAYVMGYVAMTPVPGEEDAENLMEICAAVGSFGTTEGVGPMHLTQGPVAGFVVTIHLPPALNPRAQGLVPVRIVGNAHLNVADIDPASLRLGPAYAAPAAHHMTASGAMVFDFPMPKIRFACWDHALFLYGKTRDGTAFVGAQKVTPMDCPQW